MKTACVRVNLLSQAPSQTYKKQQLARQVCLPVSLSALNISASAERVLIKSDI